MTVHKRKLGISVLLSLGISVAMAQLAGAQQLSTGSIVGINDEDSACELIISSEGSGREVTLQAGPEICEQALAGQQIQYRSEITELTAVAPPTTGTIIDATAGDRICYVALEDESGQTTNHYASFEICQQDIEGAQVQLTYGSGNILDYSCQGNVDCGKSDKAELIMSAKVLSRPQPVREFISALPDGNYRFWNGAPTNGIVSDDDLLASGERTLVVTFRKRGNEFAGTFGYISDNSICVQGQINENTVTGIALQQAPGARPIGTIDTFASFNASDRLKLRRGYQLGTRPINANGTSYVLNIIRYNSALLNMEGLNKINAGTRVPPERC